MRRRGSIVWTVVALAIAASCGGSPAGEADPATTTTAAAADAAPFVERMGLIDEAVAAWRAAGSVEEAQGAAETAANLIVGPNGPGYGDRNADGIVGGESAAGVLPGTDGTPDGLAVPLVGNACVERDVLGGSWDDPAARWSEMTTAIGAWRRDSNTMPTLASHPMRVVGWATFTLATDSLAEALEYGGHAELHVDVSLRALDC